MKSSLSLKILYRTNIAFTTSKQPPFVVVITTNEKWLFICLHPLSGSTPSSRNRSIHVGLRHILPCVASLCKTLHYSKTRVPWQIKSTFIIVLFLLVLPEDALFC